MLDNQFALLFIRGERPVKDLKYDILKHPNVSLTVDGSSEPYVHGSTDKAVSTILFTDDIKEIEDTNSITVDIDDEYEILSEEDLEEQYT